MKRDATWTLCVLALLLLAVSPVVAGSARPRIEVDASAAWIISNLNRLRLDTGLQPLETDTMLCHAANRTLRESLDDLGSGFFLGSTGVEKLRRTVADWEKSCFLVTAASETGLWDELRASPGFADAALDPQVSHVVVATGDRPAGGVWGGACVARRLVHLAPLRVEIIYGGPSSLTIAGTSEHRYVLFQSERTDDGAVGDNAEGTSLAVEADESGRFCGTLRFPMGGPAEYSVTIFVRADADDEYTAAAIVRHRVPKSVAGDSRARVTPTETD